MFEIYSDGKKIDFISFLNSICFMPVSLNPVRNGFCITYENDKKVYFENESDFTKAKNALDNIGYKYDWNYE